MLGFIRGYHFLVSQHKAARLPSEQTLNSDPKKNILYFITGARLDSVIYPMIRHKLSLALAAWHPSDRSAKFMLLPWNNVFSKGDMDSFLIRNILPKLGQILDEFIINPQHQVLGEFSLR